jgi:hypothetical protein
MRRLAAALLLSLAVAPPATAARMFNNSATNYLSNSVPVINAFPASISAWIYPTSLPGSNPGIAGSFETSASIPNIRILLLSTNGAVEVEVDSQVPAQTTANVTLNKWNSAIGVFSALASRTAYLNGGNAATNSSSPGGGDPTGLLTGTAIGVVINNGHSNPFAGAIADVCFWNVALTPAEAKLIASPGAPGKFPCYMVRPQNIVAYYPLYGGTGNEPDYSGRGNTMLVTGVVPPAPAPPGSSAPLKPGQTIWSRAYLSPSLIGNRPLGAFTPLVGGFTLSLIPLAWREGRRRRAAANRNLERQRRTEG